jgi:hypothetical protein
MRTGTAVLLAVAWIAAGPHQVWAESSVEGQLRDMAAQLQRALKRIDELEKQVQQQKAIGQATQKQAAQASEDAAATAKTVQAAQPAFAWADQMKRFTLFGDLRTRFEGFYHEQHLGPVDGTSKQVVTARNRERIRARIGLKYTYSDELSATFRIASGDPNDPISTNDDLGGIWNRKHVNLDWAYLTFTPGKSFGIRPGFVSINAGKFPNPMFRPDEMVWDEDISPEGLSETFNVLDQPMGFLDQVRVHAIQWTLNEISNGEDTWVVGGQVNPVGHVGDVQLEAGIGQYFYVNPDQIAVAANSNTKLNVGTSQAKLGNTNLLTTDATGKITGFQGAFNETNVALAATIPNVACGQPLRLWTDYVHNWQGATDDAHGVSAGVRLGNLRVKGDWSVAALYEYLGREAVNAAFSWSDFGFGGTNYQGPGLRLDYQLLDPLSVGVGGTFTNLINRQPGVKNSTMERIQADAMVKF